MKKERDKQENELIDRIANAIAMIARDLHEKGRGKDCGPGMACERSLNHGKD